LFHFDHLPDDCLRSAEKIGSRGPLTRRYRVPRQYLAAWNDLMRQYQPAKSLDDVQAEATISRTRSTSVILPAAHRMNSRVIILLVAAAILLAVLVPAIVFIATVLLLVTPILVVAQRDTDEVFGAQPVALRSLALFRAPPSCRV
jgi:hypothetical protein